jgi:hypothetical protein
MHDNISKFLEFMYEMGLNPKTPLHFKHIMFDLCLWSEWNGIVGGKLIFLPKIAKHWLFWGCSLSQHS